MSEEIKELTAEELAVKERMDAKLADCTTEEEAYRAIMGEVNAGANGELNEADLELVAGGMSAPEALKIISVTYWYALRHQNGPYSRNQVAEAVRIGDKLHKQCPKAMLWCIKTAFSLM